MILDKLTRNACFLGSYSFDDSTLKSSLTDVNFRNISPSKRLGNSWLLNEEDRLQSLETDNCISSSNTSHHDLCPVAQQYETPVSILKKGYYAY